MAFAHKPSNDDTAGTLRELMQRNSLTQANVADLACVAIKTVESWLADKDASWYRKMHPRHLRSVTMALPSFIAKRKKN